MLYGKITPVAQIVKQVTPFESTTIEANYMTALARPYGIGATKVNFEVLFGNTKINENNEVIGFERISSYRVVLEGSELSSWGTDDTVVLQTIASKLNVTASNFITINDQNMF
jgi:hypothetical protein